MEKVLFEIEMTSGAIMKGEMYPEVAPISVENFKDLIERHFFDGLVFHRVIPDFMIQGGGFDANLRHKESKRTIKGEFLSNGFQNSLRHERGVISMARTMVKDSATSQFFIMHEYSPHLDGEYAAFGRITEGLETIDQIAYLPRDARDCPYDFALATIKTMRLL